MRPDGAHACDLVRRVAVVSGERILGRGRDRARAGPRADLQPYASAGARTRDSDLPALALKA